MPLSHACCVAPMLDWTDRHCRYFHRLISRHVRLYSEMITTGALLHGDPTRLLAHDDAEHPVALQLGGSDPEELAICARIGEDHGYDEINLNVGCPSGRVQRGRFGACLMAEPERVADCIAAMRRRVAIPVTVKTRIGVDDRDRYEDLATFVATVADAGCEVFIIHARKAWLSGLSPKENRTVPPLRYDVVVQLKRDFPNLSIVLNGGLSDLAAARDEFNILDGLMVGREAYHNPYCLAVIDGLFYGDPRPPLTRPQIIEALLPYIARQLATGARLHCITRHILGLFHGIPGASVWRRHLSQHACRTDADVTTVIAALDRVMHANAELQSGCFSMSVMG